MKHIILILILIPLLIFAGDTPLPDENEAGEPITPDYTTRQKDVKAAMMDLRDVSDDFFQETGVVSKTRKATDRYLTAEKPEI